MPKRKGTSGNTVKSGRHGAKASSQKEVDRKSPRESDLGEIKCCVSGWNVDVVQGPAPDAATRMSRAIDILLGAAAHPRE